MTIDIPRSGCGAFTLAFTVLSLVACGEGEQGAGQPTISVSDQAPEPTDRIQITEVVANAPSWVVIREDLNGSFGAMLGYTAVVEGTQTDVEVNLDRGVRDGEQLWALLQVDQGEVGVYEFPGPDEPILDNVLGPVAAAFTVSVPGQLLPSLTVEAQVLSSSSEVLIDRVTALDDGFVVIHAGEDTTGELLAASGVVVGTTDELTITLSRAATDGETLHASLWADSDNDEAFDPTLDTHVLDPLDGSLIGESFRISLGAVETIIPSISVAASQLCEPPERVIIESVTLNRPGFIALYDQDPTEVEGSTALGTLGVSRGSQVSLVVTLEVPLLESRTLYAALHDDIGSVGTFEKSIDPIIDVEGAPLVVAFEVEVIGGIEADATGPDDTHSPPPVDVGPEDIGAGEEVDVDDEGSEDVGPVEDASILEDVSADDASSEDIGPEVDGTEADVEAQQDGQAPEDMSASDTAAESDADEADTDTTTDDGGPEVNSDTAVDDATPGLDADTVVDDAGPEADVAGSTDAELDESTDANVDSTTDEADAASDAADGESTADNDTAESGTPDGEEPEGEG